MKQDFLDRVRAAIPQGTASALRAPDSRPRPDPISALPRDALVARFGDELTALGGTFVRLPEREIAASILDRLSRLGTRGRWPSVMAWQPEHLPAGLLDRLRREGVEVLGGIVPPAEPERGARLAELAAAGAGLTAADAAIAETGTLALCDGPGRGRLASLLPPVHIAIVREAQVFPTLEAYFEARRAASPATFDSASAVTLISGPSRTADIEMTLTIGVHGPGEVVVYCVEG